MVKVTLELDPSQFDVLSRLIKAEHKRLNDGGTYPSSLVDADREIYFEVVASLDDLTPFPFPFSKG